MGDKENCPKCSSPNIEAGYGFAGGGCGVYFYCIDCDHILDKFQDPEAQLPGEDSAAQAPEAPQ